MSRRTLVSGPAIVVLFSSVTLASQAKAADLNADPATYRGLLSTLNPGDTLHLAAGTYTDLLPISDLNGNADQPITIAGPESGAPALFTADPGVCCNMVELTRTSYLVLKNLTLDGANDGGSFGVSAKGGSLVHHITIEGCRFQNFGGDQQQNAISTKTPTWGWVIRRNTIVGAGTGMYLGNSDGSYPFIGGLIEFNLIRDTIGYNAQIKWQKPRPAVEGMPTGASTTIVRHNVFIKNDQPSPSGDRPNLLVGGFPDTGAGSSDRYEIYGNLFYHNPREALFQGSGRVALHDNIFVDTPNQAIVVQNHDLPLKVAQIYNNTFYSVGIGIYSGGAQEEATVVGNLIFATTPMSGTFTTNLDNLTDTSANAGTYVTAPSTLLGAMNFYPKVDQCQGTALDLSAFSAHLDYLRDFDGTDKGERLFRGAYAGAGTNPGWQLDAAIKGDTVVTPPGDGATSSDGAAAGDPNVFQGDSAKSDSAQPGDTHTSHTDSAAAFGDASAVPAKLHDTSLVATGCACQAGENGPAWLGLWGLLFAVRRRRA